jgi:hypothetical protein
VVGSLVEFTTATPLNGPLVGRTTGTVNPGVIMPMDAHSGRDLGVRAQAHLYLSEIFPDLKPIFGK